MLPVTDVHGFALSRSRTELGSLVLLSPRAVETRPQRVSSGAAPHITQAAVLRVFAC